MTNPRLLFAGALVTLMVVGCGAEPTPDKQDPAQRLAARIMDETPPPDDAGAGGGTADADTVTFTATQTGTQTQTANGVMTVTTTATSTTTQAITSTDTTTTTETSTETSTASQTATATATDTTTETKTATGTASASQTRTTTGTNTATGTQTRTITETTPQTETTTATMTAIATDTATVTNSSTYTRSVTSTSTASGTFTSPTVLSSTQTYVLTGTVTATNTATVSGVSWSKALGRTITTTATQFLLGTASKAMTATVTNTLNGTETKTVSARVTGTGTQTGTSTVTATATRTLVSTYMGNGNKTFASTVTASGTATRWWTYHPTSTLTQTLTSTATETLTDTQTDTQTVTSIITPTLTLTGTVTATLTPTVTSVATNTLTVTNTSTESTPTTVTNTNTVTSTITTTTSATDTITVTTSSTSTATHTDTASHVETTTSTDTSTGTATGTVTVTSTVTSTVTNTATISSCLAGYPGPGVIDGSVVIGQTHQISDLQGVWCIAGNLEVVGSTLADLAGLEALVAVGGSIRIDDNSALTNVNGLGGLKAVGWGLAIDGNPALLDLAGLSNLRSLRQDLSITNNQGLPACWAWQLAGQLGAPPYNISNNTGTGTCGTLPEGFVCQPGATGPGVVDHDVYIGSGFWGMGIHDLGGVTCITGNLGIAASSFTDLSGLETLVAVGQGVMIDSNPNLTNVAALANLKSIAWGLSINNNSALTSLAGLSNLHSLGQDQSPRINNNPMLPACWTWEIARQTNTPLYNCSNNTGTGTCGALPEGFVCQPGVTGPGVVDHDVYIGSGSWGMGIHDLGGVTCITGNLGIAASSFTDLSGLETLVAVGQGVMIDSNPNLTNVAALANLKSIAWGLSINNNSALTSLAGLSNLHSLGQDQSPRITNNPMLPACWTWEIARQTNTPLYNCSNNTGTGTCGALPEGFVCQPGVTGPGVVDHDVYIGSGSWGMGIHDLGGVTCITGNLGIAASSFTDLSGLETLVAVGQGVMIDSNPNLTNVAALANLKSIAWGLSINNNAALTSLAGLANLRALGQDQSPRITNNPMLPACWTWEIARQTNTPLYNCSNNTGTGTCGTLPEGFVCQPGVTGPGVVDHDVYIGSGSWGMGIHDLGGVTCITGNLGIAASSFTDLSGLETLVAVGQGVMIDSNPNLTNVAALANLKSIGWGLSINNNAALTSLAGLANLRALGQDQSPRITNNPMLPACWTWEIARQTNTPLYNCSNNTGTGTCGTLPEGFVCQPGVTGPGVVDHDVYIGSGSWGMGIHDLGGVTCITGNLGIAASSFTDLSGLETLVAVGQGVMIDSNPNLTNVAALANLKSIGWGLSINNNPALTSLAGLSNLRALGQAPWINRNPLLPACWAERVAEEVGQTCSCADNDGSEACP